MPIIYISIVLAQKASNIIIDGTDNIRTIYVLHNASITVKISSALQQF